MVSTFYDWNLYERDSKTQGRRSVKIEAEIGVMQLQAKELLATTRS